MLFEESCLPIWLHRRSFLSEMATDMVNEVVFIKMSSKAYNNYN